MTDAELPLDRWTSRRAEYLAQTTVLSDREAEAVAYSEKGFSEAGIAKRIGATESTVGDYLNRAVARFGPRARHSRRDGEIETDLSPVGDDQLGAFPKHQREVWQAAVEDHPDYAPPAVEEAQTRAESATTEAAP